MGQVISGPRSLILKGNNEMWWHMPCQAWWCTRVILGLGMSREEDHRSEASLGYITRSLSEKRMREEEKEKEGEE